MMTFHAPIRGGCLIALAILAGPLSADELRVAVFRVDATPPLGSPVAYAPARSITDPLSARGVVLLGAGSPIVLCAVDWIGIANGGHDVWRDELAQAAGTDRSRVAVHTLHQHDGVRCDFSAETILAEHGLAGRRFDTPFARHVIKQVARAIRDAVPTAAPVTHLGVGQATVEKVASNRRILGPDGQVAITRYSASRNPEAIAAPEGTIDPVLKTLSFWQNDRPLVCLTYYATHPQSFYGKGDVTAEFVGLARAAREAALDDLPHVHFNGASGNVAAGKYNDGSPEARVALTQRMADGMRRAWEATTRTPITAADVAWKVVPVQLPVAPHLQADELQSILTSATSNDTAKLNAATKLAFLARRTADVPIELARLRIKHVDVLHLPGELFVEYQLAAQTLRPKSVVCTAAYGDYAPGYIGTDRAYNQGGYETSPRASNVAPPVEQVLLNGLQQLLE